MKLHVMAGALHMSQATELISTAKTLHRYLAGPSPSHCCGTNSTQNFYKVSLR